MSEIQHRDALKAGHKLHWYAIERILGQGGFGITYLARDTNLDQLVAIKEFLPAEIAIRTEDLSVQPRTGSDSEQYKWGLDRFLSEARTLAQFDHPNIVRIFSVFEANHTAYLIMRYEQGVSFSDYLGRHKYPGEEELLDILLPILEGMKKVHEAGFIHRDIQPANIFIRNNGSPVLLDFGAAREATGKPHTMTILIAPGYAPFEQYYSSSKEQGPWTDIYGLGATMYRAIAGVAPIDAIERSRGMLGSTRDLLVPASVVGEGRYSERFLSAIDHALKFSAKDRPQSIADWLTELAPDTGGGSEAILIQKTNTGKLPDTNGILSPAIIRKTGKAKYIRAISMTVIFALGTGLGMLLLRYYSGQSTLAVEETAPVANDTETSLEPPRPEGGIPETAVESDTEDLPNNEFQETEPVAPVVSDNIGNRIEPATEQQSTEMLLDKINILEKRIADQNLLVEGIVSKGEEKVERNKLADLRNELDKMEEIRLEEQRKIEELVQQKNQTENEINQIKSATPPPKKVELSITENPLQPGLNAFNEGNYETALELLRPLAKNGDPVAEYHLAVMYRNGQGILANNNIALNWMLSAARDGHTDAQIELARMYLNGINGVQDPFLAYTWYLVAEMNEVYKVIVERRKAEVELQPEQLPQAAALAAGLHKQQGLKPAGVHMNN